MNKFFTEGSPVGTPPITADQLPLALHVYYFLLITMSRLRSGDVKQALDILPRLQKILEQWQPQSTLENQGYFHLPLNTTSFANHLTVQLPSAVSQNGEDPTSPMPFGSQVFCNPTLTLASHIQIQWLSKSQLFCLVYFLSGLCHKSDSVKPTGKLFLMEGLNIAQREIDSMNTDISLLRGENDEAEMAILEAIKWANALQEWDQFKIPTSLRWGMLCQQTGRSAEALAYFEACYLEANNLELRTLLQLHKVLIYIGPDHFDQTIVRDLLDAIRNDCENNLPAHFKAAFKVLDSIMSTEFLKAKTLLLEALKICGVICNSQLKALTLAFLSTIFYSTENEQTEKMLTASYLISEKGGQSVSMLVTGALLGDLYQRQNARAQFSKQLEVNKRTWETAYQTLNRTFISDNSTPEVE
ncbi:hypothetical protein BJ085DRAFT_31089 [Dimargaris cristalligena]|uniref:Cohesin loading factor-domain-containing protein n=1 Tax=Dimargaris cristalligena TaxID=215637 RepID=A0A4P9ZUY9_9FUNG|nr:hypothetical protein BJ085DRAFT_31089 [Dimargaris cristalligena]|eukprot:RKP37375.1 hypothetical protein BJ085DRAFT_31089 [Dimargaris cristalligena]